ncbi:MAG: hypothetical protein HKN56_09625 [Gammaproteobacteria bacterium]|nr:hypothetical protein [Gammaproteobacteria bacterium]
MAKSGISIIVMLGIVAGTPSLASNKDDTKVYRWQDEKGASHYGDYVPPEYAGSAHSVLNEHGVEVETVTGPLSEQEKARQAKIAASKAQAAEAIRAAAIRDKVLLSTYLSVAEIEALRDRRMELLGGQIRITQKYLDNLREKLLKLEREAQRYSPYSADPGARPIDEKLARELSETLNSILLYEQTLAKSKDEQRQVEEKFAADIRRFNELQGLTRNDP